MVFSSAVFLFLFLPVLFAVYHIVPGIRGKNIILVLFSLVFYCFGNLAHLPLLLASVLVNWGAGRVLGALDGKTRKKTRRLVVSLAVALNIAVLAVFKYADFFVENANAVLGTGWTLPGIALPLGISFFTFTGMSYVIEVFRKPANMSRGLLKVMLYISLFPNILSGPILSYKVAAPQLEERTCTVEKTARGLRRFILGMAKKVLVADIVGGVVDAIYAGGVVDARLAWLGVIGYAIQIYFDFSGYSDMALGLAGVFGFEFPENFNQPYTALGITDFWKRWHISLTTWFRNYLYMPMVMSRPLQRLYKRWAAKYGRPRANRLSILIPTAVVWLLTGLWHGAAWTYVLWGLWHGLFALLEGVGILRLEGLKKSLPGRVVVRIYTMFVILLGTVLFRSGSMAQVGQMLGAMFAGWRFLPEATLLLQREMTGLAVFCFGVGIVGSLGVVPWLRKHTGRWGEPLSYVVSGALLVLCIMSMAGSGFQPFIYLQF